MGGDGPPLQHRRQTSLLLAWSHRSGALGVEDVCQLSAASSECWECLRTASERLRGRAVPPDASSQPLLLQDHAGTLAADDADQPNCIFQECRRLSGGEPASHTTSVDGLAEKCDGGGALRIRGAALDPERPESSTRTRPSRMLRGQCLGRYLAADPGSPEQTPEPTLEEPTPTSSSTAPPQAPVVRIQGLRSRPELNGRYGRLLHYSRNWERCHVMLLSGEGVRVRPVNLVSTTNSPLPHEVGGERRGGTPDEEAPSAPRAPDAAAQPPRRRRGAGPSPCRISAMPSECPPAWCAAVKNQPGSILVAGGFNSKESTSAGFFFLPMTSEWYPLPPTNRPRSNLGSAFVDGRFYLFGGYNNDKVLDSVECLDTESGCWQPMPKMPNARAFANVAAIGDHIYVCGGCAGCPSRWPASTARRRGGGGTSVSLSSLDRFTLSSRRWEVLPSMKQPRTLAGLSVMEGHIYIVGGCNGQEQFHKSGEIFSPSSARWTKLFALLWRCVFGAQVVHDRFLYLCGGSEGDGARSDFARLRHGAGDWERLPSMRAGRMGHLAAATPAGDIFVCGGKTGTVPLEGLPFVEIFRGAAGVWEQMGDKMGGTAVQSCFCGSVQAGDQLYILGGRGADGEVTDVALLLDLKEEEWRSLAPMPSPLIQGAYTAVHPRKR